MIDIAKTFDQWVSNNNQERKLDGKWHPSSMWGCPRAAVLAVQGMEPKRKPDAIALRRFLIGHRLHEAIQAAIGTQKGTFYPEFGIDIPELNVVGNGDGLLVDDSLALGSGSATAAVVLEFKSVRKSAFKFGMKPEHLAQGATYAVAVNGWGFTDEAGNIHRPTQVQGVMVVYFDKEDLEIKQWYFPYDPEWEDKVRTRVAQLEKYRDRGMPQCLTQTDPKKEGWRKNYCAYWPMCELKEGDALP